MPRLGEDLRNVTLIAGSAVVGLAATAALFATAETTVRHVRYAPVVEVRVDREPVVIEAPVVVTSGAERIYGEVVTTSGETLEGFLRWDKNEGSWADLLDAVKIDGRSTQTGVRFGHIDRIEVLNGSQARFEMRSGDVIELAGHSTDLGTGMRRLVIDSRDGSAHTLRWRDLSEVRFQAAPESIETTEQRLHGRVTTRDGQEFVGFVTWDIDEIHASDVLDGEVDGQDVKIPFGAITGIERLGPRGVEVTLHDGERLHVTGSNDVDSGNAGITVSDPGLGQVRMDWRDFDTVEFFPAENLPARAAFENTGRVEGTVTGSTGDSWRGAITWDLDEAFGWEILNGHRGDAEFFVEFGQVRSIEKVADGSRVTLRDGRSFVLSDSQDVDDGNRGVRIENADGEQRVRWSDFRELRVDG